MTRDDMAKVMEKVFEECKALRSAGQKEYAHDSENAFANFERVATRMGISPKQALMVYMEKHLDGIHSYLKGHISQREGVEGRINDVIVYACLLRGMIEEEKIKSSLLTQMQGQQQQQQLSSVLGSIGNLGLSSIFQK